jgi:hypothetical protein
VVAGDGPAEPRQCLNGAIDNSMVVDAEIAGITKQGHTVRLG